MTFVANPKIFKILKGPNKSMDSGWSWVILLASFWSFACTLGFMVTFGLFYTVFLVEFGQSAAKTAWVGSLAVGLALIVSPLASALLKRFGARVVTCFSSFIMAVSLISSSFVTRLEIMFITYGTLYGIGAGLPLFCSYAVLPNYFVKRLSLAAGIMSTGTTIAPLFMTPFISHLLQVYNWRITFRILGLIIGGTCFLAGLCFIPTEREKSTLSLKVKFPGKVSNPFKTLLKDSSVILWLVAMSVACFAYIISHVHQVQFALDFGVSRAKAEMLPTYMAIGGTFGRITAGILMDLNLMDNILFYYFIMMTAGIVSLLGSLSRTYLHLVSYAIIFMVFDGGHQAMQYRAAAIIFGIQYLNELWAITLFVEAISLMLGPPLVGLIVDLTDDYRGMFYLAGIPLITASLLGHVLRFKMKKSCRRTGQFETNKVKDEIYAVYDLQEKDALVQRVSVL